MSNQLRHIVIVGAGQAADSAVMSLRAGGYQGRLTLVGEEPVRPYQRPPLTKAFLKGSLAEEHVYFKHAPWYEDNHVDLLLDCRVESIDAANQRIAIQSGGDIEYDALILATGSRPKKLKLPGIELGNVFDLRTLRNAHQIKPALRPDRELVVIGGGYIGLEAAASAQYLGLKVTVLEYAPRPLARVTSALISEFFERQHRLNGVDVRTNARLKRLQSRSDKVAGVELDDGTVVPADIVLIAVGITPNEELAATCGMNCNDGIVVDNDTRSNVPNVFAVGDCTRRPLIHYNREARLESVQNAVEQGKFAAAAVLGMPRPNEDCPWFWSEQYDLKLQIAGLSQGHDSLVVRGNPDCSKFSVFYFSNSKLIACDAINSPQEFMLSKRLITAGASPDPALLADESITIKEIAVKCAS